MGEPVPPMLLALHARPVGRGGDEPVEQVEDPLVVEHTRVHQSPQCARLLQCGNIIDAEQAGAEERDLRFQAGRIDFPDGEGADDESASPMPAHGSGFPGCASADWLGTSNGMLPV